MSGSKRHSNTIITFSIGDQGDEEFIAKNDDDGRRINKRRRNSPKKENKEQVPSSTQEKVHHHISKRKKQRNACQTILSFWKLYSLGKQRKPFTVPFRENKILLIQKESQLRYQNLYLQEFTERCDVIIMKFLPKLQDLCRERVEEQEYYAKRRSLVALLSARAVSAAAIHSVPAEPRIENCISAIQHAAQTRRARTSLQEAKERRELFIDYSLFLKENCFCLTLLIEHGLGLVDLVRSFDAASLLVTKRAALENSLHWYFQNKMDPPQGGNRKAREQTEHREGGEGWCCQVITNTDDRFTKNCATTAGGMKLPHPPPPSSGGKRKEEAIEQKKNQKYDTVSPKRRNHHLHGDDSVVSAQHRSHKAMEARFHQLLLQNVLLESGVSRERLAASIAEAADDGVKVRLQRKKECRTYFLATCSNEIVARQRAGEKNSVASNISPRHGGEIFLEGTTSLSDTVRYFYRSVSVRRDDPRSMESFCQHLPSSSGSRSASTQAMQQRQK